MQLVRHGQAAKELGIDKRTLRRWGDLGLIRFAVLPVNRERRYPIEEIERVKADNSRIEKLVHSVVTEDDFD